MDLDLTPIIEEWAQEVVERAQRNLGATRLVNGKKRRAVYTGDLKNSLTYVLSNTKNFQFINFTATGPARKYASYVEYGTRGGRSWGQGGRPRGTGGKRKSEFFAAIEKWIRKKPVRLQKPGGGFIPMTDANVRSAAFLIARSIAKKGTVGVRYFTDAIEAGMPDLMERVGAEVERQIAVRLNTAFK